jgi:hypothetical protein
MKLPIEISLTALAMQKLPKFICTLIGLSPKCFANMVSQVLKREKEELFLIRKQRMCIHREPRITALEGINWFVPPSSRSCVSPPTSFTLARPFDLPSLPSTSMVPGGYRGRSSCVELVAAHQSSPHHGLTIPPCGGRQGERKSNRRGSRGRRRGL